MQNNEDIEKITVYNIYQGDKKVGVFFNEELANEVNNFLNKKKKTKPKLEIPQDMLSAYNEMFPNIKGGSGKRLRCNLKELEKAFQYFFKSYPDTTWLTILQATALYLDEQEKDGYKWTRTAKYFCIKFKQAGQPESELIEFCERVIQGDNFEEKEQGFEPKVY